MRVPLSWLRELTPVDLPVEELVALLDELGLAVESAVPVGDDLDGVVVARVLEIAAIPGADRIRAVVVEAGGRPVPVVCGASNFAVGDLVPLAPAGATLPGGHTIAARRIKEAPSEGMLCAPDELGLPGGHEGILVLPADRRPGEPVAPALGLGPDVVLELEVNANRPDAMAVAGVARDVAARLGLPLTLPDPPALPGPGTTAAPATVEVDDPDRCGRFVAQALGGVVVGPSPPWLAARLALAGMRPINNVVDASNYVMLELGQPNHPYDLGRLPGRGLRVRRGRPGERLVTLDQVERRLGPEDLLICDAEDDPVGIAGVMGGSSAEISPATTEVLLEAAWFEPLAVARTAKRLNLRTEASARFERGCDPEVIELAVRRFCQLLAPAGAVPATGTVDVRGNLPGPRVVGLRTARVNAVLGTELSDEQVVGYLRPLGFATVATAPGAHDVTVPTWRPDSSAEIDVIEEVARLHGYSAIPRTVPPSTRPGGLTHYQRDRRLVRQVLAGAGAYEAWSSTFVAPADLTRLGLDPSRAVAVANPVAADESLLRPSLLPGLVGAVASNAHHRVTGVALFEIGHVFHRVEPSAPLPGEREVLGVALAGEDARSAQRVWQLLVDGLLLPGAGVRAATAPGLHPTRTAEVVAGGEVVGVVGEVDPDALDRSGVEERVAWLEVDLARLLGAPHGEPAYRPVSRYPSSDLDLAFEVDESTPAGEVARTLGQAGGDLVHAVRLFDVYRGDQVGPGRRSLAYRVRLQADDHTLADEEVADARRRLIEAVEAAHPARLRG